MPGIGREKGPTGPRIPARPGGVQEGEAVWGHWGSRGRYQPSTWQRRNYWQPTPFGPSCLVQATRGGDCLGLVTKYGLRRRDQLGQL